MRTWQVIGGIAAAIFLAMVGVIVGKALAGSATEPRSSDREHAERELSEEDLELQRPDGAWVAGLGVIEPAGRERSLQPAVPGRIATVEVSEGMQVEAGQLLLSLDSAAQQAALDAAEAEARTAELDLQRVSGGVRRQDVEALRSEAEAAAARAELSSDRLDRLKATAGSAGLSEAELDRARQQAEQDGARAEAAHARLRSAEEALPLDVRLARARRDAAVARREQARAAVRDRRVVAPVRGEILDVSAQEGEYVTPGTGATVILGDTRTLRARIDIAERDIDRVSEGAEAVVAADAMPDRRFEGTVVEVGRRLGPRNVGSEAPGERVDVKVLEVVVDLGSPEALVVGQRVTGYVRPAELTRQ